MKRTLSLILAVIMLLGCLSITVFADGTGITIGGVEITDENVKEGGILDDSKFPVIKEGTVTYTAATEDAPAKLTLNNATIDGGNDVAISVSVPLEIVLTGENTVVSDSENNTISTTGQSLTFSGTGNLIVRCTSTASDNYHSAIVSQNAVTLSEGYYMFGTVAWSQTDFGAMYRFVKNEDVANECYGELYYDWYCNNHGLAGILYFNENEHVYVQKRFDTDYDTYEAANIFICKSIASQKAVASGSTGIKAVKQANSVSEGEETEVSFEIVIPSGITLNKSTTGDPQKIGTPFVTNVKKYDVNTVISYTATATQLTLAGGTDTMETNYYILKMTNQGEEFAELTDEPIEVFKENKYVANPPALYVGVTPEEWYNAKEGTYTATVTFDFEVKRDPCSVKVWTEFTGNIYRIGNVYGDGYDKTYDVEVFVFEEGEFMKDKSYVTTVTEYEREYLTGYDTWYGEYPYPITGDIIHTTANNYGGMICTNGASHHLDDILGSTELPFKQYVRN